LTNLLEYEPAALLLITVGLLLEHEKGQAAFNMAASCGSTCLVPGGFYSYDPNVGGNAVMLAIYALLLPPVTYLGFRSHTPLISGVLASGYLLGMLGLLGRIMLHRSRDNPARFLLSLLGTVLAPSLFSVAIFVVLPHLLSIYGERPSRVKPILAESVLYTLAIVAIGAQVVGAALLANGSPDVAVSKHTWKPIARRD
jgi:hypothetical protein